jgi:ketosteroid isomerase-like protein
MPEPADDTPLAAIERLRDAQNAHDLDAFVACFSPEYRSEQPAHPARAFVGREQVRKNWGGVFAGIHDFHAELLAHSETGTESWAEWRWSGTHADGTPFEMRGATIFVVRGRQIERARLYMEPVEQAGVGIEETVRRMAEGD